MVVGSAKEGQRGFRLEQEYHPKVFPPVNGVRRIMDHALATSCADEGLPSAARSITVEAVRAYFDSNTVNSLEMVKQFSWQDARSEGDSKQSPQHYNYGHQNCLMAAVVSENVEVVKCLLARKAINLSACNLGGLNVLHFAANFFSESIEIMELLLSSYEGGTYFFNRAGVDEQLTPLDVALRHRTNGRTKDAIVALMREHGCCTTDELKLRGYTDMFAPPSGIMYPHGYDDLKFDQMESWCKYAFIICVDFRLSLIPGGVMRAICDIVFDFCKTDRTRMAVSAFEDMLLQKDLLHQVYACGFEHPSALAQKCIVPQILGYDVVARTQSGDGKISTYAIGCLQTLNLAEDVCQAIVLCPTRTFAGRISNVMSNIGADLAVKIHACVRRNSLVEDVQRMQDGVHVAVGTPRDVLDLVHRGAFDILSIKTLVLDEAHVLMTQVSKDQVYDLINVLPKKTQKVIYFASEESDVSKLIADCVLDPVMIGPGRCCELSLTGVLQYYVNVEREEWRFVTLCDVLESCTFSQVVVYCNTSSQITRLTENLAAAEFPASALHEGMDERERDLVLHEFRCGNSRILITTNGLVSDMWTLLRNLSFVINYDLPVSLESYILRVGRSSRFDRRRVALTMLTAPSLAFLDHIEKFFNTHIDEATMVFSEIIARL